MGVGGCTVGGGAVHCARHVLTNTRPQQLCWGDWEDGGGYLNKIGRWSALSKWRIVAKVASLHAAVSHF